MMRQKMESMMQKRDQLKKDLMIKDKKINDL